MTIIFDNDINLLTISELIAKLELGLESQHQINLFFATDGGDITPMKILLDFLNKSLSRVPISIFLMDACYSAGTFILTNFQGNIYITETFTLFLFHNIDSKGFSRRKGYFDDKELDKNIDITNNNYYKKLAEIGMSKKQIQLVKEGEEVIWYRHGAEIKEMLKRKPNIKTYSLM